MGRSGGHFPKQFRYWCQGLTIDTSGLCCLYNSPVFKLTIIMVVFLFFFFRKLIVMRVCVRFEFVLDSLLVPLNL